MAGDYNAAESAAAVGIMSGLFRVKRYRIEPPIVPVLPHFRSNGPKTASNCMVWKPPARFLILLWPREIPVRSVAAWTLEFIGFEIDAYYFKEASKRLRPE